MKPRYKHDCKSCRFAGSWGRYDVYECPKQNMGIGSYIARYGSDGPEYYSAMPSIFARVVADILSAQAGKKADENWLDDWLLAILCTVFGEHQMCGVCGRQVAGGPMYHEPKGLLCDSCHIENEL